MDERKKTIRDLEEKKQENLRSAALLLENFGSALLARLDPEGNSVSAEPGGPIQDSAAGPEPPDTREEYLPSPRDIAEYHLFLKEISDSEAQIETIEADSARLKILEEDTLRKEQEYAEQTKAISGLYIRLGEQILEDSYLADFTESYRKQLDALTMKIKSLEDRLEGITEKEDINVFSWIGKNAQGMVIRSFLGKNQNNVQRICAAAGEQFARARGSTAGTIREEDLSPEIAETLDEIEKKTRASADIKEELIRLREERRKISESFSPERSPAKKIQRLERHIVHSREQLSGLYRRYGGRVETSVPVEAVSSFLMEDEAAILERVLKIRKTIREYDIRIEALTASLAIDEEREAIVKKERAIAEQRQRIAAAEAMISDFEGQITEAKDRIADLSKKL
jgi:septal ring factor EnvC (AmiA/AmiB activator)